MRSAGTDYKKDCNYTHITDESKDHKGMRCSNEIPYKTMFEIQKKNPIFSASVSVIYFNLTYTQS